MSAVPWDPRLSAWLDRVEAGWAEAGLSPLTCGELRARLVEDLVQALTEGAPVDDLLAPEPGAFARDVAVAAGYDVTRAPEPAPRPRRAILSPVEDAMADLTDPVRFVVTALAGLVVTAMLSWFVLPVVFEVVGSLRPDLSGHLQDYEALGIWAVLAVACAGGAGLAVRLQFRGSPLRDRAAWCAVLALVTSGLVVTPVTMAFAWTTGYSTLPGVVLTELGLVLTGLALGLGVATRLVWRRPRAGRVPHNAL